MKNKFLLLMSLILLFFFNIKAQVFITELSDPNNEAGARFVELYNAGDTEVDLSVGWKIQRYTNGNTEPQGAVNLTGIIPARGFYIICNNGTTFNTVYGFDADQDIGTGNAADSNGDDQIQILNPSDLVVDIFGVPGEDGSGTCHEFEDGRVERVATVTTGNMGTWNDLYWNVWADSNVADCANHTNEPQNAPEDFDPGAWIGKAIAGGTTCEEAVLITAGTHHSIHTIDDDYDQWFMFTATVTGTANVENCASDVDIYVVIEQGACGTTFNMQEDACGNIGYSVDLTFNIVAGQTYFIGFGNWEQTTNAEYDWNLTETSGLDNNSYVDNTGVTQPAAGNISSLIDELDEAVEIFQFNIVDAGTSDGVDTKVTEITIKAGANNTANWINDIGGYYLFKESSATALTITTTPEVQDGQIKFYIDDNELNIADGGSELITFYINMANTTTDNLIIECMIDADEHGFTADANGSAFANEFTNDIVSEQFVIDVEATQLIFKQQPTDVIVGQIMSPAVEIAATDINGNIDIDFSDTQITIESSEQEIIGTNQVTTSEGIAVFDNISFDTEATGVNLFTSGVFSTAISMDFNILETLNLPSVFFSEYIEGSSNNKALEIYNGTDENIDLSDYAIWNISNGGDWTEGQNNAVVLSGTLTAGATYVIVNGNADDELLELANLLGTSATYFNGDDAVGLAYNGTLIDAVGTDGEDPGSGWNVAGITNATQNHTLVRKSDVIEGNTNWISAAGTNTDDSEWIVYDQDDFTYLGWHGEDIFAPTINGIEVVDENTIIINFSEELEQNSAETVSNYTINNSIGNPTLAVLGVEGDNSKVTLTVTMLSVGLDYTLTVDAVEDLLGNTMSNVTSDIFNYVIFIGDNVLVINEIHYNPSEEQGSDDDYEFIEIYNAGVETIALEGFSFTEGIVYTFPADIFITQNEYIVIARNEATYTGGSYQVFQWTSGSFGNSGESIKIEDSQNRQLDYVYYSDSGDWTIEPDGNGPSLSLLDPILDNSIAESWAASPETGGTPGVANFIIDTEPPLFETGFPAVSNIGATSFNVEVQLDEIGTAYYVVVEADATAPSVNEVINGWQSGGSSAISNGTMFINMTSTTFTDNATNLSAETNYDIYFVAEDDENIPNIQETVTLIENIQTTQDDFTAPEFITDYPAVTNIASTTFDIEVQLNEVGTVFYIVYTDGTDAPDITTLLTQGEEMQITSSNTTFTETITGLTQASVYDIYFVAKDDETIPNIQNEVTTVQDVTTNELISDLIISEYLEGSANNKAIEIYNPTEEIIDLADYVVKKASNGGGWEGATEIDLVGSIAVGDVFVISNSNADPAILNVADITSEITYFNGNDAVGLFKSGELIDVFGDENSDIIFDVAGVTGAAEEHTIIRKSEIEIGNTDWLASAGTNVDNSEWIINEQNDFSFIGWHITPPPPSMAISINELMADNETVYEDPDQADEFDDWIELYNTGVEDIDIGGLYVSDDISNPTKYQIPTTDPTATTIPAGGYIILIADEQIEQGILHINFNLDVNGETFGIWDTDGTTIIDITNFDEQTTDLSHGRIPNGNGPFVTGLENPTPGSENIQNINDVSIYEIQYTTEPGANNTYPSPYDEQIVITTGIVTFVDETDKNVLSYYIQDGSGAWNGIYVYDNTNTPAVGDEVNITALVSEYNGLTELSDVTEFEIISTGNYLPNYASPTTEEAGTEDYEGVLIAVSFVECINYDAGNGMWEVNDGSGTLIIDDNYYSYTPGIGIAYNVTGLVTYSYDEYKLLPRFETDVEEASSVSENKDNKFLLYPNPVSDFVYIENTENIESLDIYNYTGQRIKTVYNNDNQIISIDVSSFKKGLYIINLTGNDNNIYVMRFVIF